MAIDVIRRDSEIPFIPVDEWVQTEETTIFRERKGVIIAPIHSFYKLAEGNPIDFFSMTTKKCYNRDTKIKPDGTRMVCFREHCTKYMNYFETFYDTDRLLLGFYSRIKFLIDAYPEQYTERHFRTDLFRYFISYKHSPIFHYELSRMNKENYVKMTSLYKNTKNPCLEYKDIHAMSLMEASLIQCLIIPLISHFMYIHKTPSQDIQNFLMTCFDPIYNMIYDKYGIDLKNKLYETIITNIGKNRTYNSTLWDMQAIRGINPTLHAANTMQIIITQIVPKYKYCENIISFNSNVIKNEITYKIIGSPYEYDLIPVSSSERDEDNNSQTDKFEAYMIKQNEALSLQLRINCKEEMKKLEQTLGPFSEAEINFYIQELSKDGHSIKTAFQTQLITYLFMSEFGDTNSIKFVNIRDYIILMLAAKRKLQLNGLYLLAEIISGRVEKIVARKTVNKAILLRMKMSENYQKVLNKYRNENILEDTLFGFIAKTIASEFSIIDYYDSNLNGKQIEVNKDLISEQFLVYSLMI